MRTLIVSDLHLGSLSGADLLRRPEPRAALLAALVDVDRLVLLGDVLELRHGPPRDALAAARPFFEDLGRVLAGREVVVCAGNHDHLLAEPWLAERALRPPRPLGLEQRFDAVDGGSPLLARLAEWAAPARVSAAYPGLWVRPDVYATHGHYLDCHLTVPTLERLSVAAMSRVLGRPAAGFDRADDYEAVTAPMYAWRHAAARDARTGNTLNGIATVHAWRALGGGGGARARANGAREDGGRGNGARGDGARGDGGHGGGERADGERGDGARGDGGARRAGGAGLLPERRAALRRLRTRALVAAFPLAVAALNRAGLGPLRADISAEELRRAGLLAMDEVAARLGLDDAYVIFGHTHRAGPLPGDAEAEWRGRGGARLVNSGCWTYDSVFLSSRPGESPYWPGTCVVVDEDVDQPTPPTPPVLKRLLLDRSHAELRPRRAASAGRGAEGAVSRSGGSAPA